MLRAYIRPEPRFSASTQKRAIDDLGKKIAVTYIEGERSRGDAFPERTDWIKSLRPDTLAVVSDFHRIATDAAMLKTVRAAIKAQGAIILEARTGRRSDDPDALGDMVVEAAMFYARKGMTEEEAQRLGRLGAANSKATRKWTGRMPTAEAIKIWRDNSLTYEEALAKINGDKNYRTPYSSAAAYRYLGIRGVKPGPKGAETKPRRGWVYFLQDGTTGPVKIGYSKDPESRINGMRSGQHSDYRILFVVRGTPGTESKFHKRFAAQNKTREWFHYDGALKRFILSKLKERRSFQMKSVKRKPVKR